jgi:hypothetical protein
VESGTDLLEDEARRRALAGSDLLLMFTLKSRRPWKFRDNSKVELSGPGGGPVKAAVAAAPVDHAAVLDVLMNAV